MEQSKREWGQLLIGQRIRYSRNSYRTRLNNNVLVAGASGSGKTTGIVIPNLCQAKGSYIVVDPKGSLHTEYSYYLKSKGYEVKKLSFINPRQSCGYNFFRYIRSEQDVLKVAHMLIYGKSAVNWKMDPFWDEASEMLLSALIGYLWEFHGPSEQNLESIMKLLNACEVTENDPEKQNPLDLLILREAKIRKPHCFCVKQYQKFRVAAGRTLKSILISLYARIGRFDYAELNHVLEEDEVDIASIGQKKTAVFVEVSDTDRSLDQLANLFFSQSMQELCRYADECTVEKRLPVEVQFIMDDFHTKQNLSIHSISENGRKPGKKISASATVLLLSLIHI